MTRTVIVGDVHGCAVELEELFDRVALTESDQVFFVGDLVSRGPQGRRVLELVRRCRGRSVRGNHETRLLEVRHARKRGKKIDAPKSVAGVIDELDENDWALIEALPFHLDVTEHDVRIVHAGVVPGTSIEEQDPWVLTNIRTVRNGGKPSSERDGTPWAELYDGPPHVVFGHDARGGLQVHRAATGLDTGCVYGGALTALALPERSPVPPADDRRDALISIKAREAYCEFRGEG
jgi:hypothetical protein